MQAVSSMPNVFRYGINKLIPALSELVDRGLKSILIFGIVESLPKDATGSSADSVENPVIKALPKLKAKFPGLTIACDVCLCPYTSHGHCGVLGETGAIDHAPSVKRIAEVALAYAKAGADIVAPSDMMDNRIKAIKDALVANKLQNRVRTSFILDSRINLNNKTLQMFFTCRTRHLVAANETLSTRI
ncbi:jg21922, partial [Pararge aegeria aegeria]